MWEMRSQHLPLKWKSSFCIPPHFLLSVSTRSSDWKYSQNIQYHPAEIKSYCQSRFLSSPLTQCSLSSIRGTEVVLEVTGEVMLCPHEPGAGWDRRLRETSPCSVPCPRRAAEQRQRVREEGPG